MTASPLPLFALQRRSLLSAGAALLAAPLTHAQFRVEVNGVGATQIPIAIAPFRDDGRSPQPLSAIVQADLERSGLFRSVAGGASPIDETARPALPEWKTKGADALLTGSATKLADGRFDVRFRLWDTVKGKDLAGQSLLVTAADLRLAAHRIADTVFETLTGQKGVFSTRIAYVSRIGRRSTLWIADADGENAQSALGSPEPIISPAWSPDGQSLAYVSFERGKAMVYVQNIASGQRRVIASFKGSNSAPAFSPDGKRLAVTLTRDGVSQIYVMDTSGQNLQRLSQSDSIETEAAWAPDGGSLYFVSDRSGGPQIFRMSANGGNAQRITYQGAYNISPALSPDGKWLSYIARGADGGFRVHLMDLATGQAQALTTSRDDESPSFAPNSKLIIYASRAGGRDVLMTSSIDGRVRARLNAPTVDVREPAWGPYGR